MLYSNLCDTLKGFCQTVSLMKKQEQGVSRAQGPWLLVGQAEDDSCLDEGLGYLGAFCE